MFGKGGAKGVQALGTIFTKGLALRPQDRRAMILPL